MLRINPFPNMTHPDGGSPVRGWVSVEDSTGPIAFFPNAAAAREYLRMQEVSRGVDVIAKRHPPETRFDPFDRGVN